MSQANTSLPLFYRELAAFDPEVDGKLSFPEVPANYRFAAATNVIPLLIHEVALALQSYSLVLIPGNGEEPPTLAAMVGIGDNVNRFVEADGQWRPGNYIPAWVRRYPFLSVRAEGRKDPVLAIDRTVEWIEETGGEPLYEKGKPTARMERVIAFQNEFEAFAERTRAIVKDLSDSGVLEEGSMRLHPAGTKESEGQEVKGFLVVSETKLRKLSDTELVKLHRADALGLAYAQLFSMGNLGRLFAAPTAPAERQEKSGGTNRKRKADH